MKNTDVLIYVEKIRKYLESSEGARNYFLAGTSIEKFLEKVHEIAENNMKINSEPTLSTNQMTQIKNELSASSVSSFVYNFSLN